MKKLKIKLVNWRCFAHQDFGLEWKSQIIIDKNGSGKTSLLSALYSLLSSRPWPNTKFKESVLANAEYFGISTENIDWFLTGKFAANGRLVTKFSKPDKSFLETTKVLTYTPNDNTWFFESRTKKLATLDNLLVQINGDEYENHLKKLSKLATSKQRLIKHVQETEAAVDKILLATINNDILKLSIEIWKIRKDFLQKLQESLPEFSSWIDSNLKDWKVVWEVTDFEGNRKQVDINSEETTKTPDWDRLWQKELIIGKVMFGAQRDDFKILSKHSELQSTLSRGEMRTLVLFIKNLARKIIKDYKVIWLMDDIFNELDDEREVKIFENVLQETDIFIATGTKKPKFTEKVKITNLKNCFDS